MSEQQGPAHESAHWILCANPCAGRGKAGHWLEKARKRLERAGTSVDTFTSSAPGDLQRFAAESLAQPSRPTVCVAIGGDGTLNELASGLAPGSATILGILPAGTGNVVARELSIPLDFEGAFRVLGQGRPRPIDLGSVEGRVFVFMISAGFDATVVEHVHAHRAGGMRRWHYLPAIWASRRAPEPRFHVQADGEDVGGASWAALFNVQRYAGAFVVCPKARIDDGSLRLLLLRDPIAPRLTRVLRAAARGALARLPDACERSVRTVTLLDPPALQCDGDPLESRSIRACVLPAALRVIAPAG